MKVTRQESTERYKLWNEENLPKSPFVLITPANNETTGGEIERLVIPQYGDEEGGYYLVNLFSVCVLEFDASQLADTMNSEGAYAVEAVIKGNVSLPVNGKGGKRVVREGCLQDSSINIIKSKVMGYCLMMRSVGNPYEKEVLYTLISLNDGSVCELSSATCYSEIRNGNWVFLEDSEIVIGSVHVTPKGGNVNEHYTNC